MMQVRQSLRNSSPFALEEQHQQHGAHRGASRRTEEYLPPALGECRPAGLQKVDQEVDVITMLLFTLVSIDLLLCHWIH